jgi:hypothetical protein
VLLNEGRAASLRPPLPLAAPAVAVAPIFGRPLRPPAAGSEGRHVAWLLQKLLDAYAAEPDAAEIEVLTSSADRRT